MLRRHRNINRVRLPYSLPRTKSPWCAYSNLVALWTASLLVAYVVAGSWYLRSHECQPRALHNISSSSTDLSDLSSIKPERTTPSGGESPPLYNITAKNLEDEKPEAWHLERFVERLSRAYKYVPALPCLESETRWFGASVQQTPSRNGLLFVKPYKTASSTAVGVHLRIATQLARQHQRQPPRDVPTENKHGSQPRMCKVRFDHAAASRMRYGERVRNVGESSSFLWSIVRDPTSRAVSHFYHFVVGRHNVPASGETFRAALSHPNLAAPSNYYLRVLTLEDGGYKRLSLYPPKTDDDAIAVIQGIIEGYDFLAVTERFDESMVVLQLLTGVSLASVLYLTAKRGGGYDDGGGKKACVQIPPHANLAPSMTKYLESREWNDKVQYDQLLLRAANRSLDRTIDETIGRPVFERQLELFLKAQRLVVERCVSRAVFPCDDEGNYQLFVERLRYVTLPHPGM